MKKVVQNHRDFIQRRVMTHFRGYTNWVEFNKKN